VGVQRQYSGTIGKIANCQVAASLTIATRTEHVPVDFALYLPESWTEDPSRRAEAHIPDEVTFKTKPELGVEMIERAIADGLPAGLVLADSAYGDNSEFRRRVRCEGLGYAVGLHRTTTVWRLDLLDAESVTPWRSVIWPTPSGEVAFAGDLARRNEGKMSSRSPPNVWCSRRTTSLIPRSGKRLAAHGMAAWREGSDGLYRDHVAGEHVTAPARSESQAAVAHRTGVRGRQGRAWAGSLRGPLLPRLEPPCVMVLVCFAFIVAERSRAFPPSAGKTATRKASHRHDGADGNPPGAALPGFLHHCAPGRRARPGHMVTPMPPVSQTAIDGTAWCTCP